ncbi:MAG: sensor histidine kinase [Epsilonproteobacteria bacterium]|nr:MAG: sensor histidine kinase [Campylobacterota bacterium]
MKGSYLKRVEIESFSKSFLLFFLALSFISSLLFYTLYYKEHDSLDEKLFTQMKLCSFDLKCTQFEIDFVPLEPMHLFSLKRNTKELYALFSISDSDQYALKIILSNREYEKKIAQLQDRFLWQYAGVLSVLALLSILFSFYTLHPLREALKMTEEFVKDILHDFNTPLASLRLNAGMLNCPPSEAKKVKRIELGIESILSLQNNLRSYLMEHQLQSERFDVKAVLLERLAVIEKLYPSLSFSVEGETMMLNTSRDALSRILDNLLSNAAKYNVKEGSVRVKLKAHKITIEDTGIGIEHPKKVFERFYKEHERGMGIGLHSVKKLCDEMKIKIELESEVGRGTTVVLYLHSANTPMS